MTVIFEIVLPAAGSHCDTEYFTLFGLLRESVPVW